MHPRFSLRTLLILTTLASLACAWLTIPSIRAKRLAAAIRRGDQEPIVKLVLTDSSFRWRTQPNIGVSQPDVLPLSWQDLALGRRRVSMVLEIQSKSNEDDAFTGLIYTRPYFVSVNLLGNVSSQPLKNLLLD
jgi:hypothetical protein